MPIIKIDVKKIRRGVRYTDRYTGRVKTVFPYSGSIEGYPEGYFDDPGPHQWPYLPPEEQVEVYAVAVQNLEGSVLLNPSNEKIRMRAISARQNLAEAQRRLSIQMSAATDCEQLRLF